MRASFAKQLFSCALLLLSGRTLRAGWAALGPFGGPAAVVATDPHHAKTVVVGTRSALLFRSEDAGESWAPLPFPPQLRAVLHTLMIDPRTPGVYLAGLSSELPQYSGVLRSTDSGATWRQVSALRGLQVREIAFFRGDAQIVAAATDRGVFRSRDGGLSWSRISPEENADLQPVVSVAFDPKDSSVLYAGTPHLPWKTEDDGNTWQSIYSGMIDDSDIFSILVDRNRPQRLLAGACSGIYRSLSGGAAWTRDGPAAKERTYVIAQDPQYENVLFAGTTSGMIRSSDGGQTWQKLLSYATRSIAFDLGRLGRVFIATDEGVLRSENSGKTWLFVNNGFCNRRLGSLAVAGETLYTNTLGGLADGWFLSVGSDTMQWQKLVPGSRLLGRKRITENSAAGPDRNLFVATPNAVLTSSDAGNHWARAGTLASKSLLTGLAAPPWIPNLLVASTRSSVFVSENSGTNWTGVELPAVNPDIRVLDTLSPPWIAALGTSAIFLSTDGRNWKAGKQPPGTEVYDLIAMDDSSLRAATSAGLRASFDLGASWQAVPGILEGNTVQALARHPIRTSMLFAAQFGVIYESGDSGRSWVRISPENWPVTSVKQLLVVSGGPDRLFIVTPQQGVFVLDLDPQTRHEPTAR